MRASAARLLLVLGLLLYSLPAIAGGPRTDAELRIHRIPLDGALVQNTVVDLLQDRSGRMWFGTLGGLNVYDGYEFRELAVDPDDPHALSGYQVSRLFEDRDGGVWVAGSLGWLDRMDPRSGEFRRYPRKLFGGEVQSGGRAAFHQDADGTLWLGTLAGLHRLRAGAEAFEPNVDSVTGREQLRGIRDIVSAGPSLLWIGTGRGLYRYNTATGAIEEFRHNPIDPRSLIADSVITLHRDPDDVLWVGTTAGLARFDGDALGFTRFVHDELDPRSLGGDYVFDILRDSRGRLWVGSQSGGVSLYRDGGFDVFLSDPDDPESISVNDVWSLYEDRSGLVWIGTAGGGLNQINPVRHRFGALRSVPHQPNSLRSGFVWDIAEDARGRIWMTTLAGLECHDPADSSFTLYQPTPGSVADNQLQALHVDSAGRFWVGAVNGSLYRFEPEAARFTPIRDPAQSGLRFAVGRVWHISSDNAGRVWIARDTDLVALDADDLQVVERIALARDPPVAGVPAAVVPMRASLADSDGVLWFGGGTGLLRLAPDGTRTRIAHDTAQPQSLGEDAVRALYEDRAGTLWVGTQGGLYRMDAADRRAARNRFTRTSRVEGLANDTVYGILPGSDGALWLSTNRGLSRLDPVSGDIRNFSNRDGLVSNEMNGGAELLGSDGTLYFGGLSGVATFRPDDIARNRYVPPVRLTRVEVAGVPIGSGPVIPDAPIALDHRSGELLLQFAAMDFHQPENNRFRYRLAGDSPDWIETPRNSVNLARLAPGQYRFEVHGSNGDGVWSDTPAAIEIGVTAPPWRSSGAYAMYMLIGVALLGVYHQAQRGRLHRQREFADRLASAHSLAEANHRLALRYAQYDQLTQLPNRATLTDAIGRYVRLAQEQQATLVLLLVNLDRFQRINDTLGHRLGDSILKTTGERMQAIMQADDMLARVGGDEFALVTLRPRGLDEGGWLATFGARLAAAVAEPYGHTDPPLRLTASIGVAACAHDAPMLAAELMSSANIAMHAVKRDGGNGLRQYETGMLESARERIRIEGRLRSALEAGEFAAHYQPLIDLGSGTLAGFEALIRWFPPGGKPIYPDQFIPVAEESGFIVELGEWMIFEVCRQMAEWQRPDLKVAVNVSMQQLRSGRLVQTIRAALDTSGVVASALKLEITESAMMENVENTAQQLREIRRLGVAIAIDDFGTGFSSLSHLRMLPVNELKIDRSFITDLASSEHNRTLVSSIVRLAHELKLEVVAEGVEEATALAYLHAVGCDLAQGYLFDRPQAAGAVRWHGWEEYGKHSFRGGARLTPVPEQA